MCMSGKGYKKICEFEDFFNNVCSHKTKILKTNNGEYFVVVRYNGALKKQVLEFKNYKKRITKNQAKNIVKYFGTETEYNKEFN